MSLTKIFKVSLFTWFLFTSVSLTANDWLYTVRPNEQASSIANKYLINPYRIDEILKYNDIESPSKLSSGMVLKIPLSYLKFGPARVELVTLQGEVYVVRNAQKKSLTTLDSIKLGDKVITGKNSSAVMRFADRSELFLGSEAELIFDVLTQWGRTGMVDSRMRLLKGSVEGRVETLEGPGAHFEVHTPSAVATVRGTEFRVRVSQDNTEVTYNEVSEGKVQVKNNVAALLVPQGFGTVSEKGKDSGQPIELLKAPDLTIAKNSYPAKPVMFQWQSNSEAIGYRVELYTDKGFNNQIKSLEVKSNSINFDDIATGDYALKVRAIDVNGLEGLDSKHYFELNGAPESPTQLQAKASVLSGEKSNFKWAPSDNAGKYLIEVSENDSFESLIAQYEVESETFQAKEVLAPGKYFWRVIAVNEYGKGYPSKAEIIEVGLPELPQIKALQDAEIGKVINLNATEVSFAKEYEWQISKDKNFSEIIKTQTTDDNNLALSDLDVGSYYVRVAANGPHNQQRYGETQEFEVYEETNNKDEFMLSSLLLILLIL